jgi:uncharacterized membrane protein YczE
VLFISPPPADRRGQRFVRLLGGLLLYGISDGLLLLAGLGVDPWDVLHQGLSRRLGLGVGTWVNIVGAIVLLAWIPLRQRPGVGTVLNVLTIGTVVNLVLAWLPAPSALPARFALLAAAIVHNGIATGLYIGAGLGPGPRDGLMTGIAARGHSVRVVRTGIELTVLATGWLLGGSVGIGTVAYAVLIGPIVHVVLPRLQLADGAVSPRPRAARPRRRAAGPGPRLPRRTRRAGRSRDRSCPPPRTRPVPER